MATRKLILREAFRSGAGLHQRCRSGERQQLKSKMVDSVEEFFAEKEGTKKIEVIEQESDRENVEDDA